MKIIVKNHLLQEKGTFLFSLKLGWEAEFALMKQTVSNVFEGQKLQYSRMATRGEKITVDSTDSTLHRADSP